jgi:hypothetical protein
MYTINTCPSFLFCPDSKENMHHLKIPFLFTGREGLKKASGLASTETLMNWDDTVSSTSSLLRNISYAAFGVKKTISVSAQPSDFFCASSRPFLCKEGWEGIHKRKEADPSGQPPDYCVSKSFSSSTLSLAQYH